MNSSASVQPLYTNNKQRKTSRQIGLARDCEVSVNLLAQVDNMSDSSFEPTAMDFNTPINSECGDEPTPIDFNTPINREWGDPCAPPWPPNKQQILIDHIAYHDNMAVYLTSVLSNGRDIDMPMPKPPKSKLKDVWGPNISKNKPLFGEELHMYLIKHLVNHAPINPQPWNPTSLENVKITLQEGFHILKQRNAKLLKHYLQLGDCLIHAFDYFSVAKLRNEVPQDTTWKQWLEKNIGMSDSYDRQLRNISKSFNQYMRFHYLGISIKEFIKLKEQIRLTFAAYPDYAYFWRQDTPP